jgi:hypothetical protein
VAEHPVEVVPPVPVLVLSVVLVEEASLDLLQASTRMGTAVAPNSRFLINFALDCSIA